MNTDDCLGDHRVADGTAGIGAVCRRLVTQVIGRIGADGAVEDRCGSRILESALLLILLRKLRELQAVQDTLARYICGARPAHPLEALVAQAVVGTKPSAVPCGAQQLLTGFSHFTGNRKRMLIATVLTLAGVISADSVRNGYAAESHDQSGYDGFAVWTSVSLCAMRILHSNLERDMSTELDYLINQLARFPNGVWEGNALAHLLALHALHSCAPRHPLIESGIAALIACQNPDGGLPFVSGQEIFVTALAGVALHTAGAAPQILTALGDYLACRQQNNGGWGYTRVTTQTDVDDTSRCVEFLRLADPGRYRQVIDHAEQYLIGMAGPDGGFPTYVRGHPPDVDMTAGALIALAPTAPAPVLNAATDFLISSQHENGTFTASWTLSEPSIMLRVIGGVLAVRAPSPELSARISRTIAQCRARLRETQNLDGGWGHTPGQPSNVLGTAQAVQTLCSIPAGPELRTALSYLLNSQNPDGTFTSVPDQVGPRPIPFDFLVLANLHALNAFTAINDKDRP